MYWFIVKFFAAILITWILVMILAIPFQRSLLYHPVTQNEQTLREQASYLGLEPWLNGKDEIIGWQTSTHDRSEDLIQVVVFHGNAGQAINRLYLADGLRESQTSRNIQVHLFEYPGYGSRSGSPSEKRIIQAADKAIAGLLDEQQGTIYVVGESLGCGVASFVAGKYPEDIKGVLLINAYPDMVAVAKHHYSFLPVNQLLRDRYPVSNHLDSYSGPVAFLYGEQDRIVPPSLTKTVYEEYHGPKQLIPQPKSGHNTMNYNPDADWWDILFELWFS